MLQCNHVQRAAGHRGYGHLCDLEAVSEHTDCALGAAATRKVNLRRLLVGEVFNFHVVDGAKVLDLVSQFEVREFTRVKLSDVRSRLVEY